MNSFSGYPNFMQNLTNPMQSGFSWSSFGNPRSNVRPNANKDTKFFQGNQNSGYYSSQAPVYESQNQLQRLKEEIGNLSQKLGVTLPTGGVDMRQVLQNTFPQQPLVPKMPDARQILQEIYPGINAMLYCIEYCAKRKLQMEYVLEQETGNGMGGKGKGVFTFALKVETYKGGPVLQSRGTDLGKSEAKQRAAEQMIPQLLQIFGPMSVNPAHFASNGKVGEPITKRGPQQKRVSKWAKMTDEEWARNMVVLPEAQSNPTSLLFQWAQHKRLPVPEYESSFEELIGIENVPEIKSAIESPKEESDESPSAKRRRTAAPSTPRMYTVYCIFGNKRFMGKDMDQKKAKMAASAAAWKEFCPNY